MNTTVVYGFLGAGKTTLLRRLVPHLAGHERTALLVNEFGKEGVDQIIMQTDDLVVYQVAGGCICCEVRGDLLVALDQLQRQLAPERLVIEPTGLAAPGTLDHVFRSPPLDEFVRVDSTVTVLDAIRFDAARQMFGEFFPAQTRAADVVIVNKADVATPEQLEAAERWARHLNPEAAIVRAAFCEIEPDLVLAAIRANRAEPATRRPSTNGEHADGPPTDELSTLGLERGTIDTVGADVAHLDGWLDAVAHGTFGEVVRAKGFVPRGTDATALVDVVLGTTDIRPFGAAPPRLEVIGRNLRLQEMEQALINGRTNLTQPASTHAGA